MRRPRLTAITLHRSGMISDGAAEAIKEDNAMSVFFMDFDMAPSVIWARDLYDQMQIRSDFRKWFPRMCQYGFVEGRDYEFVPRVRPQDEGGRTVQRYVKDYRITLEMAKQLYKLHHFHKNDCFRSCEGQHCMVTDHWMQAVIELLHQHKCKSHAPPKRFYESQPPDSLVTTTQIAKEYGCGAKVFNRLLHLHGIQYRANNQWVLYFDENELMIMAMFEQDTAENTKKELEEVLPYVADDMAVRLLVEQVISKMENLPDKQFKNLELDLYRPDAPEEEKA